MIKTSYESINFHNVAFLKSVFSQNELPQPNTPEIAFAGRSNVGKSSLINRLVGRKNFVKTSSQPGKTRSLNFFDIDQKLYLVDLPGYGFARVSKNIRSSWEKLITAYLEHRENLFCVVVILDLRHELKSHDQEFINWLRYNEKIFLPVYTKIDKLSRNKQYQNATSLDAALAITPEDRVLFSAKTGQGCKSLLSILASFIENC